jgi:flagellar hook-length control protein FliK
MSLLASLTSQTTQEIKLDPKALAKAEKELDAEKGDKKSFELELEEAHNDKSPANETKPLAKLSDIATRIIQSEQLQKEGLAKHAVRSEFKNSSTSIKALIEKAQEKKLNVTEVKFEKLGEVKATPLNKEIEVTRPTIKAVIEQSKQSVVTSKALFSKNDNATSTQVNEQAKTQHKAVNTETTIQAPKTTLLDSLLTKRPLKPIDVTQKIEEHKVKQKIETTPTKEKVQIKQSPEIETVETSVKTTKEEIPKQRNVLQSILQANKVTDEKVVKDSKNQPIETITEQDKIQLKNELKPNINEKSHSVNQIQKLSQPEISKNMTTKEVAKQSQAAVLADTTREESNVLSTEKVIPKKNSLESLLQTIKSMKEEIVPTTLKVNTEAETDDTSKQNAKDIKTIPKVEHKNSNPITDAKLPIMPKTVESKIEMKHQDPTATTNINKSDTTIQEKPKAKITSEKIDVLKSQETKPVVTADEGKGPKHIENKGTEASTKNVSSNMPKIVNEGSPTQTTNVKNEITKEAKPKVASTTTPQVNLKLETNAPSINLQNLLSGSPKIETSEEKNHKTNTPQSKVDIKKSFASIIKPLEIAPTSIAEIAPRFNPTNISTLQTSIQTPQLLNEATMLEKNAQEPTIEIEKNQNETIHKEENRADSLKSKNVQARQSMHHFSTALQEQVDNYKAPIMKLNMVMNPESLGKVEVTLLNRGNNIHVKLAATEATLQYFIQHGNELKMALNDLGFSDAKLSYTDQNSEQKEQSNKNNSNQRQQNEEENEELELILPDAYEDEENTQNQQGENHA